MKQPKQPKQPKYSKHQKPLDDYIEIDNVGGNEYLVRSKKDNSVKNSSVKGGK